MNQYRIKIYAKKWKLPKKVFYKDKVEALTVADAIAQAEQIAARLVLAGKIPEKQALRLQVDAVLVN